MKKGLMRGLAGITLSLLTITAIATSYTGTREAFINAHLGTSSMKLVEIGDASKDTYYYKSEFGSLAELVEAKKNLAVEIAGEGTVLLKNEDDALPLAAGADVTLWGHNVLFPARGGMIGSTASAAEGQENFGPLDAMLARGFNVNMGFIDLYGSEEAFAYTRQTFFPGAGLLPAFTPAWESPAFYMTGEIPASMYTDDLLATADDTAAVVVITRDSSEAADYSPSMFCATDGDSFVRPLALSQYEKDMLELAKEHSTKVIVLLNCNNPMEVQELKEDDDIDAVLWVSEPGIYGFLGVADVLAGNVNPSGKLVDTWAVKSDSAPAMTNFGLFMYTNNSQNGTGDYILTGDDKSDWYVVESEGIYQGYKYYETRYEDEVLGQGNADAAEGSIDSKAWSYENEISYPFGYGLSYTEFELALDDVQAEVGEIGTATVTVKNTGDVAGKTAVELYVQAPYTDGGIEKSAIQLAGFTKTGIIEPGKSETVTIDVDPALFASYDEAAVKADGTTGAWVLEAGDYYFAVGNGVHEALNNILAAKGENERDLTDVNDGEITADNAVKWTLAETDIETYSANVQNAFQDADINKLIPGTVEYTTRSDWSKGWKTIESITPTDEMLTGLRNQLYALNENGSGVTWGADNGLTIMDLVEFNEDGTVAGVAPLSDEKWQQLVEQVTLEEAINFIEFGGDDIENIDSVLLPRCYMNDGPLGFAFDQVAGYKTRWTSADSAAPTYVSGDETEAGYAMTSFPTEPMAAASRNRELVERQGQLMGEDGLWAKESIIIAPGVNLHRTVYCARNHEYYSEDPVVVNLMAKAVCTGMISKGLSPQAKHYAFNHQELNRSGMSTFMTEQAGRENELRGFQGVMSENQTLSVMTAFNRIGTSFVGAHAGVIEQIARKEWGYQGGFVTDMVNGAMYMNWRDTVAGGGGIMLGSASNWQQTSLGTMEASYNAIEKDTFFQQKMQEGIKSWLWTCAQTNVTNGLSATTKLVTVTPWWKAALYAADAVLAALSALFIFLALWNKKGKKA